MFRWDSCARHVIDPQTIFNVEIKQHKSSARKGEIAQLWKVSGGGRVLRLGWLSGVNNGIKRRSPA